MVEPAGELPPLPPVVTGPPANPEPPAEPLAEPLTEPLAQLVAQPAAANQVIASFWCFTFVLSFSYPFVRVLCVSPTFGLFGSFFLQASSSFL